MFRFCSFKCVLFVNKGQDLHQKGHTFVKIWTLTPNQTIPGQMRVIRCHLRFLEVAISRTNLGFLWRFEKSGFHYILRESNEWITVKGSGWINQTAYCVHDYRIKAGDRQSKKSISNLRAPPAVKAIKAEKKIHAFDQWSPNKTHFLQRKQVIKNGIYQLGQLHPA